MPAWFTPDELWFALFIILARIGDVSLGTMRTICVVRGYRMLAATLGFGEVIVWILAVSGVLTQLTPLRIAAYGIGFSLGNICGVALEQRLALGQMMITIISMRQTQSVAFALRLAGFTVTELAGTGATGQVAMVIAVVSRRSVRKVLELARGADPECFVSMHDVRHSTLSVRPTAVPATGWRAIMKKK